METNKSKLNLNLERLKFRRQFILGPEAFSPNEYWKIQELEHDLCLSTHQDLTCFSYKGSQITITFIGTLIDPFNPLRSETAILEDLGSRSPDFAGVIEYSKKLGGRWIIIYQDRQSTRLFTDPCGFRQIFFFNNGNNTWCASQPELIKQKADLIPASDEELFAFITNPEYSQKESAWLGDKTIYKGCFHLLPNHFLDLSLPTQKRFYPGAQPPRTKAVSDVVDTACTIVKGTIKGLINKGEIAVPLTAGWDSRVLLAASKDVTPDIEFYMDRKGEIPPGDPDVWVPEKLANDLNVSFYVRNSWQEVPGWFVSLLSQNITGARINNKTKSIYSKLITGDSRTNINGNGSEISRNCSYHRKVSRFSTIDAEALVRMFGYDSAPDFAIEEVDKWKKGITNHLKKDLSILDLFYWEQRMGNWGGQFPAEQDVAIEEVSPFNNRLFIENLFLIPQKMRSAPEFLIYRKLINNMWPEVMREPINPIPKYHRNIIDAIKGEIPKERIYGKLKSLVGINPYKSRS